MGFFKNIPEYLGKTAVLPVLSFLPALTLITSMLSIFHNSYNFSARKFTKYMAKI